jgi:membrane-bound serine protease (ClpP class)
MLALVAGLLAAACTSGPALSAGKVYVVEIDGAISVAAQRQVARAIQRATQDKADAVIIRLDTPGGLVSSTREVIREIVASPVPVLVLVGPGGARAASAGTFVVYASHLAAMAPGTNLGAATPVSMGGIPGTPQPKKDDKPSEPSAAEKKSINDTVALLRSLAQMRGRNADFAEKAVREAATMTADEAQKSGVVEFVARDLPDFLAQADGRSVRVGSQDLELATRGATIEVLQPEWRTRLLATIADPNLAFILLLIGIYGLLFEFWNPGAFVPGVLGGISLLLAMIALSLLPVHYGALALLVLGVALMIGEAFTPGIGALGIGGLVAFLVGAFFLFEGDGADFDLRVSLPLIAGAGLACAGLTFFVLGAALKARNRPPATGAEQLLLEHGTVIDWSSDRGNIRIHGEVWAARAEHALAPGVRVRVKSRDGLVLFVEPV